MITVQGTVPYPPTADAAPILTLAADLKKMSSGLAQTSSQLTSTTSTSQASWVGMAAQAFQQMLAKRSATIDEIAQAIASAAVPLQAFATAIQSTSAAYTAAVAAEWASEPELPWSFEVWCIAVAEEAAAVAALEAAGVACATALAVIEAKVAAGEYTLAHLDDHATGRRTPSTTPSTTPPTTPKAQTPTAPTTPAPVAAPSTEATADGELVHVLEELVTALHHGISTAESEITGFVKGMEKALEKNVATYTRNGAVLERWAANRGGPTTGLTYRQATAAAETMSKWGERAGAVGLVVDGVHQVMEDNKNAALTTSQRVNRTTAAVLVQGGLAAGGAEVGAEIGALVGAFFGGVGAVPGALIGGFIGGVGVGYLGGVAGKAAKEKLFETNPGGAFQ